MARIVYGVAGDTRGHVNRAFTLSRELSSHEFLFIGGREVYSLEHIGEIYEVPLLDSHYENNGLALYSVIRDALPVFWNAANTVRKLADKIEKFSPQLVITDYEYHTPKAAKLLGLNCLCVGHQPIQHKCVSVSIPNQFISRVTTRVYNLCVHSNADKYLIDSFYYLPPLDEKTTELYPPVLKRELLSVEPTRGDHILVYLTSPACEELLKCLAKLKIPVKVYGAGERPSEGLVEYKEPSKITFAEDIASCRYVVCNGGHNVIAEALLLGKPVFSFPIHFAFEQILNGYEVKKLGYGDFSLTNSPTVEMFQDFGKKVDGFALNISKGTFFGTDKVAQRVEDLILEWS